MVKGMGKNKKTFSGFARGFKFEPSAEKYLRAAINGGSRVGVACSGGADSVFLLFWILSFCGAKNLKNIKVLHFNHKARANAEKDEEFVRKLCSDLGVEFVHGKAESVPEKLSEDEFRKMRMRFFIESSCNLRLSCIAQGHHCGDVAETIVMRLARGAGLDGLCAPKAVSNLGGAVFVRPMLAIKKSEIIEALKKDEIAWREDESNAEPKFFRNKIRNILIPQIREISPGDFEKSALRSHNLLSEDADFINSCLERELDSANPGWKAGSPMRLTETVLKYPALLRRAVMRFLAAEGVLDELRSGAADAILERILNKGSTFKSSAGSGIFFCFDASSKSISLERMVEDFEISLKIGKNTLPGGVLSVKKIRISPARLDALKSGDNDDSKCAYIDISAVGNLADGSLFARNKRDGDSYIPLGSKSEKRLKDIFIAKKIPSAKRNSIPLVCNKRGRILWGVGLPPCDDFKLSNSAVAIELTYAPFQC